MTTRCGGSPPHILTLPCNPIAVRLQRIHFMQLTLRPYQQEAVDSVRDFLINKKTNPCVVLPTGCHAKGHPILMFDGTVRKVEDIIPGDLLMGPDSTPRRVLALARGREKMARIIPHKGAPFVVNRNHILSLLSVNGNLVCNITVNDYLAKPKTWKHTKRLYRVPIKFANPLGLQVPRRIERTGFSIELLPEDDFYGFELDGDHLYLDDSFMVFHNTGKSVVIGEIANLAVNRGDSRVLVLAHVKELLEQNAGKIRSLCPSLSVGIYSAGLNCRDTRNPVIVAGIQSIYRKPDILGAFDLVLIDECFPAGTMIDTPRGQIPIEKLHVGQPVRNALGVGKIEAISSRPTRELIELKLNDGSTIKCTPNHPFFTDGGWCKASDLAVGSRLFSREDVLRLLNVTLPEYLGVGIKVVRITHIELDNPCTVYNLQVKGHPSYYAQGVLVHNCHLIPPDGDGMYRTFLEGQKALNPDVRLVGFTATPFRLKGGLICKEENLLNEICYEANLKDMIDQGYLSPLVSKEARTHTDLDNLHIRGGEFVQEDIDTAMDNDKVVDSACREIVNLTRDRKTVLIFCTSIEHCRHVAKRIHEFSGEECAIVTGDTDPAERAETIERMKGHPGQPDLLGVRKPPLKFCANVAVMTTGLDIPNIDCVALMRPTASAGLMLQMCGRGLRLSDGKKNCQILDFGGNLKRFGPLDTIHAPEPGTHDMGPAPTKTCPSCQEVVHAGLRQCPCCGYQFPHEEDDKLPHDGTAATSAVLSGQVTVEEFDVTSVHCFEHRKRGWQEGDPVTVRVDYYIGLANKYSEWICPEHTGYARDKFEKWWKTHTYESNEPLPSTAQDAAWLLNEGSMKPILKIKVKTVAGESFPRITCIFDPEDRSSRIAEDDELEELPF